MIKKKYWFTASFFFCITNYCLGTPSIANAFLDDTDSTKMAVTSVSKSLHEKKYSEIHEDVLCAYENLLHKTSETVREISVLQEECMEAIKKLAKNMPKASRNKLIRELKKIEAIAESLGTVAGSLHV